MLSNGWCGDAYNLSSNSLARSSMVLIEYQVEAYKMKKSAFRNQQSINQSSITRTGELLKPGDGGLDVGLGGVLVPLAAREQQEV
jgi:hypothetical protein